MSTTLTKRVMNRLGLGAPSVDADDLRVLSGAALAHLWRTQPPRSFREAEFRVFSQFGDDGLIQYLIARLQPTCTRFVEFGVESYVEANTRFLLVHDNWTGLVLDGSAEHVSTIRSSPLYWRQDLTALHAFIDRDNINRLLTDAGFAGPLGLLSIDIDGVDWWVWEQLTCVDPLIVIAEYNSAFGVERAVTVPYDASFVRSRAHHSNLYWGCSLPALCSLADRKGLSFVGSNSAGNNAYFVKRGHESGLAALTAADGYVESKFRESRSPDGALTYLRGRERLEAISHLPLWDLETSQLIHAGDLLG